MPLSSDPEKRERQLANLRPNWPSTRSPERSAERSAEQRPQTAERSAEQPPKSGRKRRVVKHPPAAAAKPEPPKPEEPANGGPDERETEPKRGGFIAGLFGDY